MEEFQKETRKDQSERDYEKFSLMPVYFIEHLMDLINEARKKEMR
jgi:hypothetical protein